MAINNTYVDIEGTRMCDWRVRLVCVCILISATGREIEEKRSIQKCIFTHKCVKPTLVCSVHNLIFAFKKPPPVRGGRVFLTRRRAFKKNSGSSSFRRNVEGCGNKSGSYITGVYCHAPLCIRFSLNAFLFSGGLLLFAALFLLVFTKKTSTF